MWYHRALYRQEDMWYHRALLQAAMMHVGHCCQWCVVCPYIRVIKPCAHVSEGVSVMCVLMALIYVLFSGLHWTSFEVEGEGEVLGGFLCHVTQQLN